MPLYLVFKKPALAVVFCADWCWITFWINTFCFCQSQKDNSWHVFCWTYFLSIFGSKMFYIYSVFYDEVVSQARFVPSLPISFGPCKSCPGFPSFYFAWPTGWPRSRDFSRAPCQRVPIIPVAWDVFRPVHWQFSCLQDSANSISKTESMGEVSPVISSLCRTAGTRCLNLIVASARSHQKVLSASVLWVISTSFTSFTARLGRGVWWCYVEEMHNLWMACNIYNIRTLVKIKEFNPLNLGKPRTEMWMLRVWSAKKLVKNSAQTYSRHRTRKR